MDKPVRARIGPQTSGMTPRPLETVVRTDADLFAMWHHMMGPGGFATASLWLVLLDAEGRAQAEIIKIEDVPPAPGRHDGRGLARVVADLIDTGETASVAVLLSRPGEPAMCEDDRRWARSLREALAGHARWPMHLATCDGIQVFAPDDLVAG